MPPLSGLEFKRGHQAGLICVNLAVHFGFLALQFDRASVLLQLALRHFLARARPPAAAWRRKPVGRLAVGDLGFACGSSSVVVQ